MAVNWSREKILASLREKGTTAAALADQSGMSRFTFYKGLTTPYPKVQTLIAQSIGQPPQVIWPIFYDDCGQRRHVIRRKAA
jgi:Ner family transcriptional regulator